MCFPRLKVSIHIEYFILKLTNGNFQTQRQNMLLTTKFSELTDVSMMDNRESLCAATNRLRLHLELHRVLSSMLNEKANGTNCCYIYIHILYEYKKKKKK